MIESATITIPRRIPKGGINPNNGKSYANLEEKLKDYFELHKLANSPVRLQDPVTQSELDNIVDMTTIKLERCIGHVIDFNDTDFIVVLDDRGKELFNYMSNPSIQICMFADVSGDEIICNRIIKLAIVNG